MSEDDKRETDDELKERILGRTPKYCLHCGDGISEGLWCHQCAKSLDKEYKLI